VTRIASQALKVFGVASVGEFVEGDDGFVALSQPVEDEIGADEAGAACDEYGHVIYSKKSKSLKMLWSSGHIDKR